MWSTRALVVALVAVAVGGALGGRSPNADYVESVLSWSALQGPGADVRYSSDVIEDALLDAVGLVRKYGYPVEEHRARTEDGHELVVHRIPHGRSAHGEPGPRPAVLLMHGLLSSSADFLVLGPGAALGYLLADHGYDVWLGNARGNYYSRGHACLDPDARDTAYWRFSWEQIGLLDLPAMVELVLRVSGQPRLHYVGHSQGGTAFLVLTSLRPEYNDKFISFQGLAPAALFTHNEHAIFNLLAPYEKLIEAVTFSASSGEILRNSAVMTWAGIALCSDRALLQPLCARAVTLIGGFDQHFNASLIPVFLGHAPAGASIRQVAHYGQCIRRRAFARFDFDPITNLREYGRLQPPEFPLHLVSTPTYLHYGAADREVDPRDLALLSDALPNARALLRAPRPSFNHYDFIWGGDVRAQVFDRLVDMMRHAEGRH